MFTHASKIFSQFFLVFIAFSIVPAIYVIKEYDRIHNQLEREVNQTSFNQIEAVTNDFTALLNNIHTSARGMANTHILLQALVEPNTNSIEIVKEVWRLVADGQSFYSKLRFINAEGMELIRVNHSIMGSFPVEGSKLNNQSQRDFFQYATTLLAGEVGIFGVELENNNNHDIQPLTSTLRLIIPVENDGQRLGYFVANLNLNYIFTTLYTHHILNGQPTLINAEGYILLGDQQNTAYGHSILERTSETLAIKQPDLWASIQAEDNGYFFNDKQWITYSKIYFSFDQHNVPFYLLISNLNDHLITLHQQEMDTFKWQSVGLLITIVFIAITFTVWNITHKKNSMESRIAKAAMNGMSAMVITDHRNRIIKVNQEFTRASGYTLEEVIGKPPSVFSSGKHNQEFYIEMWKHLQAEGQWQGEVVNRRKDGTLLTELLRIQAVLDSNKKIKFYVASFVDITERKALEDRLRTLSEKDPLTGCWNRRKFDHELRSECLRVDRYPDQQQSCLGIVDIDHFKRVNDTLGHDEGDRVIRSVTAILEQKCRDTDFIARIGGEEFAVIMPHTTLTEAEIVMNRLRVAVFLEFEEKITISGGISDICDNAEICYKCADIALYDAKSSGRNQVALFTSQEIEQIA